MPSSNSAVPKVEKNDSKLESSVIDNVSSSSNSNAQRQGRTRRHTTLVQYNSPSVKDQKLRQPQSDKTESSKPKLPPTNNGTNFPSLLSGQHKPTENSQDNQLPSVQLLPASKLPPPKHPSSSQTQSLPTQGLPQNGLPPQGPPPPRLPPQGLPPPRLPPQGLPPPSLLSQGLPPLRLPPQGLPPSRLPPQGLPPPRLPPQSLPFKRPSLPNPPWIKQKLIIYGDSNYKTTYRQLKTEINALRRGATQGLQIEFNKTFTLEKTFHVIKEHDHTNCIVLINVLTNNARRRQSVVSNNKLLGCFLLRPAHQTLSSWHVLLPNAFQQWNTTRIPRLFVSRKE